MEIGNATELINFQVTETVKSNYCHVITKSIDCAFLNCVKIKQFC